MNSQNLFNLVKNNTCFKDQGSYLDLILANRKYYFKNTCSLETGLRNHQHDINWLFVFIKSYVKVNFKERNNNNNNNHDKN